MVLLGCDCGTSSIKATLLDTQTGTIIASATCPSAEMPIDAPQPGWAQQDPALWWLNLKAAVAKLLSQSKIAPADIKAIGITYQMHGLVCIDKAGDVIRPSIIWCDSRAVALGQKAADALGPERCLEHLLNLPGNFTAGKLAWVKQNEPENFKRTAKILLPGDWIAMKLTGQAATTESGLSEMILWDFKNARPADFLMTHYGFGPDLLPPIVPTFGPQGTLTKAAAAELGLAEGTPVTYRAGDQPNNALSLNVLNPGEVAATAGTSGVVYGVCDKPAFDPKSRVNSFVHVTNTRRTPRNGVLLCVNGTGRLNSWLKHNLGIDYPEMNDKAAAVAIGAEGLSILPYGNGAERTLENRPVGAAVCNLDLNTHNVAHVLRAAQEGIVFALNYGLDIMKSMGIEIRTVRAGKANMFLSPLFAQTFATLTGAVVELYNTDGSQGACRGAGIGAGLYKTPQEAFASLRKIETVVPKSDQVQPCRNAYNKWLAALNRQIQ